MRALPLFAAAVTLAAAGGARANAQDGHCTSYVSERTTRALYDALTKGRDRDGCELDDVHAERTSIRVVWKKDGAVLAPAVVTANECAAPGTSHGDVYAAAIPDALAAACPTGTHGLSRIVSRDELGGVARPSTAAPVSWSRRALWIGAALFALVALLTAVALWRGRKR